MMPFGILNPRLILAILAATIAVGSVVYLRYDAVQRERAKAAAEQMQRELDTRKRIDDAIANPLTPDDIRKRLRQLAE
jgi:hypothetical protein